MQEGSNNGGECVRVSQVYHFLKRFNRHAEIERVREVVGVDERKGPWVFACELQGAA